MTATLTAEQRAELRRLTADDSRRRSFAEQVNTSRLYDEEDRQLLGAIPALLDAADRADALETRVKVFEGLLGESLHLVQWAADGENFDASPDGRMKRLLDQITKELAK
jgi:hypothetical protein